MSQSNPGDPPVLGKGLSYAAVTVAIVLLGYLLFDEAIQRQFNPNQDPASERRDGEAVVILQRNKFGHYLSNGKINGKDALFFLDTGATDVSIPEAVAKRLGLRRGHKLQVGTANGSVAVYSTTLKQVQLGDIVLRNVDGNINPHMDGEEILLGMSFLGQLDFSQRGERLTLRQTY